MSKLEGINYRILSADEFTRKDLQEIFLKNNALIPNPLVSHIQVAEKDGKIIAIAVLQPQYHAEPIFVDEEYRNIPMLHHNLIKSLLEPLVNLTKLRIWVFSPDFKIANLATRFGFEKQEYEVFMREF